MSLEEKAKNLNNREKEVLKQLGNCSGESKVEDICENTDMTQSGIMRAALGLEEIDFLEIEKITKKNVSITDEGRNYIENDLPERRVLEILSKEDDLSLNEISEEVDISDDKKGITIGWIKKKNWASIEEGEDGNVLRITDKGKDFLESLGKDEKLLNLFEEDESLDFRDIPEELKDQVEVLKERGLVEIFEDNEHKLILTEEGERAQDLDLELKKRVSQLSSELIKSGKWKDVELKDYNITAPVEPVYPGKIHPQRRIIEEFRSILLRMGFEEIRGPMVESEFWNFDALFQAQNHPAREIHDTLSLSIPERADIPDKGLLEKVKKAHEDGIEGSKGWNYDFDEDISRRSILRSQTTADTVRYLASQPEPPVKVFTIDKVFRRERIDYQHLAEFPQAEGIVMAEDLNFRNMLGYLKEILHEIGVEKIRFRPGYFPYTEPSAEADGYLPERDEWIELLGAGMFRPELLEPLGIDHPVLAWGIGFSRIAMIRMGIDDMRDLHNNDLEWLKNYSMW